MSSTELSPPPRSKRAGARAGQALRARHNWEQLLKFSLVGATGTLLNLVVYRLLLGAGLHYLVAATISFFAAVTNNYLWNRNWTFRGRRGHFGYQGLRFLTVATIVLCINLLVLHLLVKLGLGKLSAEAVAIVTAMPVNFLGNKLWSFRR
jgi:putative flippase GtrA